MIRTRTQSFGQKGSRDTALTFAEQLLSGKPLAQKPVHDTTPKLKPRPKPQFGRRVSLDGEGESN